MDEHCPAFVQQISPDDWERTPSSVKQLVEEMAQRLGQLEKKLAELQALRVRPSGSQSPTAGNPPSGLSHRFPTEGNHTVGTGLTEQ